MLISKLNLFLIHVILVHVIIASLFIPMGLSTSLDNHEKIILVGKAILLRENFAPVYINVSSNICPGPITIVFDNATYSYRYECIQPLEKPWIDIEYSMYNYLNITVHTSSYIEVVAELPVKVLVEILNETSDYTMIKLSILFTPTRYSDIIPSEAMSFNPNYVLIDNRTYPINETVDWIHNLTYIVKLLNYNNYAYIDDKGIGFFPFYIITPINAGEIEKLVDKGLLEFTQNGFRGKILEYAGKPLYLIYKGPNLPPEIRSNQYIQFKKINDQYYVYEPEPLYHVDYKGIPIPVPGIQEAYIYPFKYNASQIMSHIQGFKPVRYRFISSLNQEIFAPILDVEYLYRYPIRATVIYPLYHHELLNASFILFHNLELTEQNMTLIQGYRVGYIDKRYLTIQSGADFRLIIITAIVGIMMASVGYIIWRRRHY